MASHPRDHLSSRFQSSSLRNEHTEARWDPDILRVPRLHGSAGCPVHSTPVVIGAVFAGVRDVCFFLGPAPNTFPWETDPGGFQAPTCLTCYLIFLLGQQSRLSQGYLVSPEDQSSGPGTVRQHQDHISLLRDSHFPFHCPQRSTSRAPQGQTHSHSVLGTALDSSLSSTTNSVTMWTVSNLLPGSVSSSVKGV